MVDRTIFVRLRAEVQDFKRRMGEAAKVTDDNAAAVDTLSNRVGLLGGVLTGFAGLAVAKFAEFDAGMSRVASATGATGEELEKLRKAALKAGADTAYSATEAADAILELGKAGLSTEDILSGGLSGALALAASEGLEVAAAAELTASALTQFQLKGNQAAHVADLLAAGGGKAQGSAHDLGEALNQSGLIANQFGISIEETAGALALMASNGLIGSDAGTSLKTALTALANPAKETASLMKELGINAYDANGQFIGLDGLAGVLQERLSGLTDAQRQQALAQIFGTDALRVASVLYESGAEGVREWTEAVNDSGYAQEVAAKRLDNLQGDLEALGGSFETLLIGMGEGANGPLRQLVQQATEILNAFGRLPEPLQQTLLLLTGGAGIGLLGAAALGKLAVSTHESLTAMRDLGVISEATMTKMESGGRRAGRALGQIAIGAASAIAAIKIMNDLTDGSDKTAASLEATEKAMRGLGGADIQSLFEGLGGDINSLADAGNILFGNDFNANMERFGSSMNNAFGGQLSDQVNDARDQFEAMSDVLANMVSAGEGERAAEMYREISEALQASGASVEDVDGLFRSYHDSLDAQANAAASAAGAQDEMTDATGDANAAMEEQIELLQEQFDAMLKASGIVLDARSAQREYQAALDDARAALKENGRTLDINTEAGRANEEALHRIVRRGLEVVESMKANGATQRQLRGAMRQTREDYIRMATSMGMSRDRARELADRMQLIPKNVKTKVEADTEGALSEIGRVRAALAGLSDKQVTVFMNTVRNDGRNYGGLATGGRLPGFPTGGRLPGTPPANPMQDNLLGVDGTGMPKVRVRSREWVVSQPAADYYGDGIMGALNARAIPREMLSGLPGLASGGAIDQAETQVRRAQARARAARRALAQAQQAERRARTEAAERAAERRVERAEELLDRRQDAVRAAWQKLSSLRQSGRELRTDLRRGNIRDSVTGGLSGALGVTDDLRDLAGDIGGWRERNLRRTAARGESALTRLYRDAERIDKRLERATSRLEKWQQIADNVSSSLRDGFALGDVSGGVNPWSGQEQQATGQQLLAAAQAYEQKARTLVQRMRQLQDAGWGTRVLQEVAAQGVDGGIAMADALLQLSPAEAKELRSTLGQIIDISGQAGVLATNGNLASAQAAVDLAEAQAKAIDKNIDKWARKLGKEMARALGIKPRASGGPTVAGSAYLVGEDGPELRVESSSGYIVNSQKTANLLRGAGPSVTHNWRITNVHPVAEPPSVTAARAARSVARVGR